MTDLDKANIRMWAWDRIEKAHKGVAPFDDALSASCELAEMLIDGVLPERMSDDEVAPAAPVGAPSTEGASFDAYLIREALRKAAIRLETAACMADEGRFMRLFQDARDDCKRAMKMLPAEAPRA